MCINTDKKSSETLLLLFLPIRLYPKLSFMKKYILSITAACSTFFTIAQVPDDVLRTSWFPNYGTARNMATGGVMGSLGGDITANNVNPAGLGLFKTNEFVLTPGIVLNNNKFFYRGSDTASKKTGFQYGGVGFIFGSPSARGSKLTSSAFSLAINQLASYNNRISYRGFNNASSFTEQYLEELVRDRADTNAALDNYIFGSSLAFRTYLIDTTNNAAGQFNGYKSLVSVARPGVEGVNQENDVITRGGLHEVSLGFAGNMQDKLYLGGSINIPIIYYEKDQRYKESDASNNPNNLFNYFEYTENTVSRGIGANVKMGLIYKPQEYFRLGLAFHTPSFLSFRDNIRATLKADTEGYAGVRSEKSDALNSGNPGERQYNMITPWRAIASASYVFREVNDTRKQRAFVSADLEYVNHRAARFMSSDQGDATAVDYYKTINDVVKDYYKGAMNVRVGAELKLHTIMIRGGGAYYGSPYADKALRSDRYQATGGLGYRNHGYFVDLAYVHTFNKDVQFPYRLVDKPNTFARQTGSRGNVVFTLGFKF
jgi:hypothetical protein